MMQQTLNAANEEVQSNLLVLAAAGLTAGHYGLKCIMAAVVAAEAWRHTALHAPRVQHVALTPTAKALQTIGSTMDQPTSWPPLKPLAPNCARQTAAREVR